MQRALTERGAPTEIVTFTTTGDTRLDEPLSAIGAKGLFTQELEAALLASDVDCCVHSLKDLPTESPAGITVAAILAREDSRDALVINAHLSATTLDDLPAGSRVGTSSLRRRALLLNRRADLDVVDLRGNVPTRIRKVDDGVVDAAILAAAGLHRLGVQHRITAYLAPPTWLPAAGQGAIAVQARADDARMHALLGPLHDAATATAVRAERACLAALEGGCQVPIGALAVHEGGISTLHAFIGDVRGEELVRGSALVDERDPERTGARVALDILARGGQRVLEELRRQSVVPAPAPE